MSRDGTVLDCLLAGKIKNGIQGRGVLIPACYGYGGEGSRALIQSLNNRAAV